MIAITGNRVREIRTRLGLTQIEAAERLGISQSKQSRIEALEDCPVAPADTFVAHVYGCPSCRRHFLLGEAHLAQHA